MTQEGPGLTLGLFFFIFGSEQGKNEKEGDCILEDNNNVVRRGRGRPRKEEQRLDYQFRFNGTKDHAYMQEVLQEELGMNGGEVLRYCLEFVYNVKVGWKN